MIRYVFCILVADRLADDLIASDQEVNNGNVAAAEHTAAAATGPAPAAAWPSALLLLTAETVGRFGSIGHEAVIGAEITRIVLHMAADQIDVILHILLRVAVQAGDLSDIREVLIVIRRNLHELCKRTILELCAVKARCDIRINGIRAAHKCAEAQIVVPADKIELAAGIHQIIVMCQRTVVAVIITHDGIHRKAL